VAEHHRVVGVPPVEYGACGVIAPRDQLALLVQWIDADVRTLQRTLAETVEELLVELEALLLRHERVVLGCLWHPVTG